MLIVCCYPGRYKQFCRKGTKKTYRTTETATICTEFGLPKISQRFVPCNATVPASCRLFATAWHNGTKNRGVVKHKQI